MWYTVPCHSKVRLTGFGWWYWPLQNLNISWNCSKPSPMAFIFVIFWLLLANLMVASFMGCTKNHVLSRWSWMNFVDEIGHSIFEDKLRLPQASDLGHLFCDFLVVARWLEGYLLHVIHNGHVISRWGWMGLVDHIAQAQDLGPFFIFIKKLWLWKGSLGASNTSTAQHECGLQFLGHSIFEHELRLP